LLIQYSGESKTSTTGEFIISGGSGAGVLIGTANGDFFAHREGVANAGETYVSNFVQPGGGPYSKTVILPFTYGVPFVLTLEDDMVFSGSTSLFGYSELEDVTSVDVTFAIFDDSHRGPVPGAFISAVPEVSSAWLLVTVSGGMGLLVRRRNALIIISSAN
jgi:hypothetical protein